MKKALILIPGFANTPLVWKEQIAALSPLYETQVVVMDRQKTRQEMVAALLSEAPAHFALAGHSMGGWIAQAAAAAAPKRVEKLVLFNTWATADEERLEMQRQIIENLRLGRLEKVMQAYLPLIIHPSRLNDFPLIQLLQEMAAAFSLETLLAQLGAMLSDGSSLPLLRAIQAETLVVHSREDALFPLREAETIATGIPHAKLSIIEGCGHASILENPEETSLLMRTFLS